MVVAASLKHGCPRKVGRHYSLLGSSEEKRMAPSELPACGNQPECCVFSFSLLLCSAVKYVICGPSELTLSGN